MQIILISMEEHARQRKPQLQKCWSRSLLSVLKELRKSLWLGKSTWEVRVILVKTKGGIREINKMIAETLGTVVSFLLSFTQVCLAVTLKIVWNEWGKKPFMQPMQHIRKKILVALARKGVGGWYKVVRFAVYWN